MEDKKKKSPALALFLSFIPGMGAIYNGEFIKGLAFIAIFAMTVVLLNKDIGGAEETILGIFLTIFYFYTIYDAYSTAKKSSGDTKINGVDRPKKHSDNGEANPVFGGFVLLSGVIILLLNFDYISWESLRSYWPVVLIIIGIHIIYKNTKKGGTK